MLGWYEVYHKNIHVHDNVVIRNGDCCYYDSSLHEKSGPLTLRLKADTMAYGPNYIDSVIIEDIIIEEIVNKGVWINLLIDTLVPSLTIQNLVYRNIDVIHADTVWGYLHGDSVNNNLLTNVLFENVSVNGNCVTDASSGNITNVHTANITYSCIPDMNVTVCDSYTSPSGNHTWNVSGTYTDTIAGAGCDSIISIGLTVSPINNSLSFSNNTLISNDIAATYQWVDCNNNYAHIPGETNKSFTASVNGTYAVIVTRDGCTDTSFCFNLTSVAIKENSFGEQFWLYPNPTDNELTIELGEKYEDITMVIRDVTGQVVIRRTYGSTAKINFEMEETSGIYIIELFTREGQTSRLKVVKQ